MPANPMQSLADAISRAEGYGKAGAIPTLANNPGDLAIGDIGSGTMGSGITVFPTPAAGNSALLNQLGKIANGSSSVYNPSMSISQVGNLWSGGDSNWAANVSKTLGVSSDSTIGSLLSGSLPSLPSMAGSALGSATGFGSLFSMFGNSDGASPASTFNVSRIVAILVGLILVAGGIMMFKQTSVIIQKTTSLAAKGVELAA